MEISFNINCFARVRLTKAGADILNDKLKEYSEFMTEDMLHNLYGRDEFKEGDEFRDELWSIMSIFGPYITHGCDVPFIKNELNIELES